VSTERYQLTLESLFSPAGIAKPRQLSGAELRDSGIQSVVQHTPEEYKQKFVDAIKTFARGELITAEDVRRVAGNPPPEVHYNCFGGLMRRAASQGLIKWTPETETAKRPGMHATRLSLWVRL